MIRHPFDSAPFFIGDEVEGSLIRTISSVDLRIGGVSAVTTGSQIRLWDNIFPNVDAIFFSTTLTWNGYTGAFSSNISIDEGTFAFSGDAINVPPEFGFVLSNGTFGAGGPGYRSFTRPGTEVLGLASSVVPEPSSWMLFSIAALPLMGRRKRLIACPDLRSSR